MVFSKVIKFLGIPILLMLLVFSSQAENSNAEKHMEVSMRLIGHQFLLSIGDSSSRVLPITKKDNRYKIEFQSEFGFNPDDLVAVINKAVKDAKLSKKYFVEVEDCITHQIVYSYEMDEIEQSEVIPCKGRDLPKACYSLFFTLIDQNDAEASLQTAEKKSSKIFSKKMSNPSNLIFVGIIMLILFIAFRRRNKKQNRNPNLISLGNFYFDIKNTELHYEKERIELTSKEADLLELLSNTLNETVERDIILNKVWGDEGDYIGRTLDVFISKLRKKLEADSNVKIVNIRGVGYKLVIGS